MAAAGRGIPRPLLALGAVAAAGVAWLLLAGPRPAEAAPAPPPPPRPRPPAPRPRPPTGGGFTVDIGPAEIEPQFMPPQPPPPPMAPRRLSPPFPFRRGQTYRARMELSPFEAALATPDRIRSELEGAGFARVETFASASLLDATWPPEARAGSSAYTRWVRGQWARPDQATQGNARIVAVWEG